MNYDNDLGEGYQNDACFWNNPKRIHTSFSFFNTAGALVVVTVSGMSGGTKTDKFAEKNPNGLCSPPLPPSFSVIYNAIISKNPCIKVQNVQ